MSREEKRNRRTGFFVSLAVHLGLLILFIFLLAWKEPYPPLPEYGIELNLGFESQGLGEEASEDPSEEEVIEEEQEVQEEEVIEEVEEVETTEAEEISEEIEAESVEESDSEVSATDVTEAKEVKEETDEVEEPKKEEKPKVLVTYKPGGQSEGVNEGEGDMGDPQGNEDSENYEGKLGGGGGAMLDLSGWKWERPPKPDDRSDATGRIVFEIRIDRYGKVIGLKTLEKTVSPLVVSKYREEVLKTRFIKTGSGAAAEESVGKITFIIKSS